MSKIMLNAAILIGKCNGKTYITKHNQTYMHELELFSSALLN